MNEDGVPGPYEIRILFTKVVFMNDYDSHKDVGPVNWYRSIAPASFKFKLITKILSV